MPFDLGSFLGSNIGEAFAKIVGCFKVSPEKQLEASTELAKIQAELQSKILDQVTAQIAVNQVEAASPRLFVAGWRPFIGWVCGIGLATQFLVNPLATWIAALAGRPIAFPSLDTGTLLTLLLGMLGLGTMRTFEKVNGASGADKLQ